MLKQQLDFCLIGPRLNEVRAAEGRQEVVQGLLIGQVHDAELQGGSSSLFASEQIVRPDRQIKQIARSDAGRIRVRIECPRRGDGKARGAEIGAGARRNGIPEGSRLTAAEKPDGRLLRGGEAERIIEAGHRAGNFSGVKTPGK